MTTFKARGLVLREYEAGESDKRIVLLCVGRGRLPVYARGARKAKSKFLAASQMLTYGDYVIADGGRFYSMSQAEVIEGFYSIRRDYDKLCHAQYILEVCEKTVPDNTPCDNLLKLALKALQHISGRVAGPEITPGQAVRVFLFRFFLFYGLAPEMDCCCLCDGKLDSAALFCDEGMVCRSCQKYKEGKTRIPLSISAQEAVRHILRSDVSRAFMFRAQASVLDELEMAAQLCWFGHFPITLQSDI